VGKYNWSEKEIAFLKENYPKMGRYYCSNELNIPLEKIVYKIRKLGLKKDSSLNVESFFNIRDAEMAYILGFMWSDGYVSNDGRHFSVGGVENDISKIEWLFDKYGNWCKHYDDRSKYGWQNTLTIIGSNVNIHSFLIDNDYQNKSYMSADKILNKIPDNLKNYWFRGLIDGDGCFYINKTGKVGQFTITSTYEQNWFYFEKLCEDLEIKYKISKFKKINKTSGNVNKYSILRILGSEIIKLGEFLYQGKQFGLDRKLKKFNLIKKCYVDN
jgi:hypothetical protein